MTARPGLEWSDGAAGPVLSDTYDVIVALAPGRFTLAVEAEDIAWQDRALCAQTDPEAFFPEKGGSTREAKKVCRGCEVRAECLEYAVEHGERFGIWGGLSERERRRMKPEAPAPRALPAVSKERRGSLEQRRAAARARLEAGEKRCAGECGQVKPLDDFSRHPTSLDGHQSSCKDCSCIAEARRRGEPAGKRPVAA